MKKLHNKNNGITLVALVVTIIILLILAGVAIAQLTDKGLITRVQEAKNENEKQTATEMMNLKITNIQISSYTESKELPTLQYLADKLCEDNEMEYVKIETQKVANLEKIEIGEATSIFTKIKKYPYEFEINNKLQLASIDGIKISDKTEELNFKSEYINNVTFSTIEDTKKIDIKVSVDTTDNSKIFGYHYFVIDKENKEKIIAKMTENNTLTVENLESGKIYMIYVAAYDVNNRFYTSDVNEVETLIKEPLIITSTEGKFRYYDKTASKYLYSVSMTPDLVQKLLFDGESKTDSTWYNNEILIGRTSLDSGYIYFTVNKKLNLYAYGNNYKDSSGSAGNKVTVQKYNSNTNSYESYSECETKADGNKYLLMSNLEPGKYKLWASGNYVGFDEWKYELIK